MVKSKWRKPRPIEWRSNSCRCALHGPRAAVQRLHSAVACERRRAEKLGDYYDDPIKTACDKASSDRAFYLRDLSIETGLTWRAPLDALPRAVGDRQFAWCLTDGAAKRSGGGSEATAAAARVQTRTRTSAAHQPRRGCGHRGYNLRRRHDPFPGEPAMMIKSCKALGGECK
jgi:hypothetical protein